MFKLKSSSVAVAVCFAASSLVFAPAASAITLTGYTGGPLDIKIAGVDSGALYNFPGCVSIADCNLAANIAVAPAGAISPEDSWGVFQVTSILQGSTPVWSAPSGSNAGERIFGKFGGVQDVMADVTVNGFTGRVEQQTASTGGTWEMWVSTDKDQLANAVAAGPLTTTRDIIGGSAGDYLWLSGVFAGEYLTTPGVTSQVSQNSYSDFEYDFVYAPGHIGDPLYITGVTPRSLQSYGYMDVTGGFAQALFDPGHYPDAFGNPTDASFAFVLNTDLSLTGSGLWTTPIDGPVNTWVIPEPGSLALAGIGLLGLSVARRRKQV